MSSSALRSLMQYRFKKQSSDKIQPVGSSKEPTDDVTCVSDTPSPSSSPVFKGAASKGNYTPSPVVAAKKKYSRVIVKESDSESSDDESANTNSSPWLSKQGGVLRNGHVSNSVEDSEDWSSQPSTSSVGACNFSSSYKSNSDHMSFSSQLQQLSNVFPHKSRQDLEGVLQDSEDIESAINIMLGIDPGSHKRPRVDEKKPVAKVKRRRIMENNHMSSDDEETTRFKPEEQEKINFLKEAFPNLKEKALAEALQKNQWSIEDATSALSNSAVIEIKSSDEEDLPDLKTAMNGTSSIRTMQKAQKQKFEVQKKTKKLSSTTDDDSFRTQSIPVEDSDCELVEDDEADVDSEDSEDSVEEEFTGLSKEKQMLLSFFNDARVEELVTMPGCSKKKAELVKSVRPFKSWDDMTDKLLSTKGLGMQLLTGCKELIYIREDICRLMENCEKIAGEMEEIVADLMENVELSESEGHINRQPKLLNESLQLKPYQMVGLNWLMLIHRQELNGILADEMGLGKTVQAIAFLTHLLENGESGPHVIIVPSSTLDNWLRELKTWCPTMKVVVYYGSQEDRKEIRFNIQECGEEFNVMVTTYNLATGSLEDRVFFKKFTFHYVVLDEAHMVKNMSTLRYQNLMKIKAKRRLLLTGTPLQNNLVELMSLLCFVMPDLFIGKTDQLKRMFTNISKKGDESKSSYEKERIRHAKQIMKPFVLRRLKTEVLKQLPKKKVITEFCPLTCEQEDIYNSVVERITAEVKQNNVDNLTSNSISLMMQLRRAACHPLLMRTRFTESDLRRLAKLMLRDPDHREANPDRIFEDMEVMSDFELHKTCLFYPVIRDYAIDNDSIIDSAKLRFLDNLLPTSKQNGDRVLIFSQFTMMMDILEDYMKINKHKFFRLDGQTPVVERQDMIDKFNNDQSVFIFLLSTRAGGLGINLTSANVVVIHDLDFNPHNDRQAEDRCHRVGQTRDVTVYRLITKNTIEEAILKCADSKLELEKDMNCNEDTETTNEKSNDVASLLMQALGV